MCSCCAEVVVRGGDGGEDLVNETCTDAAVGIVGKVNTDEEFGCCDCGDHDVIVVGDHAVEALACALGRDENGRVEDQPR